MLLVLIAIIAVVGVELRTALGFFDIQLSITSVIVLIVLAIGVLVFWATLPTAGESNEE
ncbi:CbaC protein [Natribaculum luteum]|uniref:CbaC protein n=2 Tax=Natribaculum luteum TaxID=1586232 RepID=A0ABD5NWI1_9EURY|nr:CbaC protein [Natribaculum luteum]